jgi:hypothetical protein
MTPGEFEQYVQVMRSYGVKRFQGADFQIEFGGTPIPPSSPAAVNPSGDPVNEINSLLKMNDNDLVDRLFPLPKEDAS